MLAAAKADFEPELARLEGEQRRPRSESRSASSSSAGSTLGDEAGMMGAQGLALASPIERSAAIAGRVVVSVKGAYASSGPKLVRQIGLLPGEAAVRFRRAAEMAVSGGARIDRLVEVEMLANAARREVHDLHQRAFELGFVDAAGPVQVGVDRQRLGDADRVGELQGAALGQAGGDDVLGEIARGVGGRAVDLGRVLAREGAAAVRRRAAVGVDDDLAPGEAAIAVGSADVEFAGRVDVPDRSLA